ncbi:MAG: SDR family NAD(P)-dependent oxidoreductase [Acidimicrobiales bacterium]
MVPAFDLTGRVALVTGAGSPRGIGFATARLLASLGASVLVTATTPRVEERASELRASGVDAWAMTGDLTDPDVATALVRHALERRGRLDIVVQNAGMTSLSDPAAPGRPLGETSWESWRSGVARNLDTTFLVVRAALAPMSAAGWGRVVVVTSVTGPVMAMRAEPVYAAAKAGVVGLVRSVALDYAARGITANAVAPGWIATASQTPFEAEQGRRGPMGRSAEPEEVAAAIGWLATPGASYVTGQCVVVDGGNSIGEER